MDTRLGLGVGLRNTHFDPILRKQPAVDWFEAISENFTALPAGWPPAQPWAGKSASSPGLVIACALANDPTRTPWC